MPFETQLALALAAERSADLLAVAVHEGAAVLAKEGDGPATLENALLAQLDAALVGLVARAAADEEFTGKDATSLLLHTHGKLPAARLAVLGLGRRKDADKDRDQLRAAAARAVRMARAAGAKVLALAFPL